MSRERRANRFDKTKRGENLLLLPASCKNPPGSSTKTAEKSRLINSQLIGNCPNRGKYRHRTDTIFQHRSETICLINAISSFISNESFAPEICIEISRNKYMVRDVAATLSHFSSNFFCTADICLQPMTPMVLGTFSSTMPEVDIEVGVALLVSEPLDPYNLLIIYTLLPM